VAEIGPEGSLNNERNNVTPFSRRRHRMCMSAGNSWSQTLTVSCTDIILNPNSQMHSLKIHVSAWSTQKYA